jgi:CrcB protein
VTDWLVHLGDAQPLGIGFATVTGQLRILAVISLGGVLGSLGRYGIGRAFPASAHGFPWATFGINVSGCVLIGVLMVYVLGLWPDRTLVRPFLGTGVLGGYTTFSTYAVDVVRLADAHAAGIAIGYLFGTLFAALAGVYAGMSFAQWTLRVAS